MVLRMCYVTESSQRYMYQRLCVFPVPWSYTHSFECDSVLTFTALFIDCHTDLNKYNKNYRSTFNNYGDVTGKSHVLPTHSQGELDKIRQIV